MADLHLMKKRFVYSTRDLLIMAVLAALGGVASTYIQMFANAVNAFLGFPGATQWAAGLHVLWLVLAIGITGKPGTGIITGTLKGSVELMSGNTHGVIILVVNIVAGLLIDFGFLLFKNRNSLFPYIISGGLAAGSNVLIFQIFARVPLNVLTSPAILILSIIAMLSGVFLAGFLGKGLLSSLAKAGVIRQSIDSPSHRKLGWMIFIGALVVTAFLSVYIIIQFQSSEKIEITGAVSEPYQFPDNEFSPEIINREIDSKGLATSYQGYALSELIDHAQPNMNTNTLLITATDGYSFLLSFEELYNNPNILLTQSGRGQNTTYSVVGPVSSKAWVRNIKTLTVIAADTLKIQVKDNPDFEFDPDEWLEKMDSTGINLPSGTQKLQGVPVHLIVQSAAIDFSPELIVFTNSEESLTFSWDELDDKDSIRIFTVINSESISFALADMLGELLLFPLANIEIE